MSKPQAKIRILDEVGCIIVGLHSDHYEYFYDKYGVHAPNYFFNPRYTMGQWDGKLRYFSMAGKTYTFLLDDLLPRIVGLGYRVDIEDLRPSNQVTPQPIDEDVFSHIMHIDTGKPIKLRDYQVDGVNALLDNGYGILIAGTGSGKTLCTAALSYAYNNCGLSTLVIVPNRDLISQTKADYVNCKLDVGEYSGTVKTLEHQNVITTWQALKNNPKIIQQFQVVIVDECHGAKGAQLQKILTDHSARILYRFGVTGTLPKDPADLMSVHIALGPVRYTISAAELIDRDVLAKLHIDIFQIEENLQAEYTTFCNESNIGKPPTYIQFKDGYFPDYSSEKSHLQHNYDRIEWIANLIEVKRDMVKGNVLCLVDNITLGRKLAELVPGSYFVNGQDMKKPEKRKIVYDMFKDRDDLVVFATSAIASTGLSINRIFNLVLVDVGKSFVKIVQSIGRGLRKSEDKDNVTVSDVCSDLKYSKKHLAQRIAYYKESQYPHKKHRISTS
jgi:superfamily II DNA or RNA helicase